MKKQQDLLHTPEGVRDIYDLECEQKLVVEEQLFSTLRSFGYRPIETPTFEFFDVFGKEIGTTPSRELYKFFDRDGNTLVLRPDITPSVARAAAKFYMEEEQPLRFCYQGRTFLNNLSYQGRLKECTQIGAELLSDTSVDADAEILAMAVQCLQQAGIQDFQIGVGHALYFAGLIEDAALQPETAEELRELIENKNFFGMEAVLQELSISEDIRTLFLAMGELYSDASDLEKLMTPSESHPKVMKALERLKKLYEACELYGIEKHISYELGMIGGYEYYTGIVFAGFSYGSGEPILRGGRYDKLLSQFGKNAAAIGFAFVTDQILSALNRQKIPVKVPEAPVLLVYDKRHYKKALEEAAQIRRNGGAAELVRFDKHKTKEAYLSHGKERRQTDIRFFLTEAVE
ncbi:MAG: ATP phosphoribosyltransferase regulatory subunit [Lachnospiraceae bacterium]|nr:ATP phosphoribosyltransferase regulatory subunit [Lachnospiraceae bacterium]